VLSPPAPCCCFLHRHIASRWPSPRRLVSCLRAEDLRHRLREIGPGPDNGEKNARLVAEIAALPAARGITAAQLALAWVHRRAAVHGLAVIPIPGTRKVSRLEENLAATRITLSDEEAALLEPLAAAVHGNRNPS
jgi:aryl-alcohol dehydrogenase-like predicted oxidoreductase